MKTKAIVNFAVLGLFWALVASAQTTQYVTVKNGNYPTETNQIITLVGYDWLNKPTITGSFPDGTVTSMSPYFFQYNPVQAQGSSGYYFYSPSGLYTPTTLPTQIFTGLTNIFVNGTSATFRIDVLPTTTVVSNYVPADAIVIPAAASGNVQIILESSPDLVNWTAASLGIYGVASQTNRFFRVRAVAGP